MCCVANPVAIDIGYVDYQRTRLPPAVESIRSDDQVFRTEFKDGGVVLLYGQVASSAVILQLRVLQLRAGLG